MASGAIAIDANGASGAGQAQVTGAAANTNYEIDFCPFETETQKCFAVGNANTDASGNVTATFQFPRSGIWAGDFQFTVNGKQALWASFPTASGEATYLSPLQRAAQVSGGIGQGSATSVGNPGSDPLSSGQLTVTVTPNGAPGKATLQLTLKGAAPNQTYTGGFCGLGASSSCYGVDGSIMTDASGNATGTLNFTNYNPSGVFFFTRSGDSTGPVEFITGFQTP